MSIPTIEHLLVPKFPKKHVTASIVHFTAMTHEFQKRQWDDSIAKGGKFVEAVLKSLHRCGLGQPAPTGKAFKADKVINALAQAPAGSVDDTIRVLIPRACRFIYDIASNRGGRHDPDEIDANEMDATAVVANCSWVLAEMIRFAQKGALDLTEARNAVVSLLEKKYSLIEEVEGRIYFHGKKKTGPDVALVALAYRYPGRILRQELVEIVRRNGFTQNNANVAVCRIMKYVDESNAGLRVLSPGLAIAEQLLENT